MTQRLEHQTDPLLELRGVSKRFVTPLDAAARLANLMGATMREQVVHAVEDVDLAIAPGEVVGLAGESGCGKSTLGRIAVGLHPLSAGERWWKGELVNAAGQHGNALRLGIQMVFQDPYASLNPRLRVLDIIGEAPVVHGLVSKSDKTAYCQDLLQRVGLQPAMLERFPHQFSGGQRARIGIARALALRPELLICDEPVAALDVSVQAQVINLFMQMRREMGLAYLFISHDLSVVRHLSDRVVIMYLGRIVESARTQELFSRPNHPYTRTLLAAVPQLSTAAGGDAELPKTGGEPPSPSAPPAGCSFHTRCPYAMQRCQSETPALKEIAPGHISACHLNDTR